MPRQPQEGPETDALTLSVPVLAPSLNTLLRTHYRDRGRDRDKWTALLRHVAGRRRSAPPCAVAIVRRYASRPLDLDNLYAAAKVPLDALVRAGILPDDDPTCVASLTCTQEKVPTRLEQGTTITLRPITAETDA